MGYLFTHCCIHLIYLFKKKCQVHLPFLKSSMHLCELSSTLEHPKGPQALFCIHHEVQQAKGCRHQTVAQSSVFLTLNQIKDRLFVQQFADFHCIHIPLVTLDACKMKLVVLRGLEGARQSLWQSGNLIQKIQLCVSVCFVSFPHTHRNTRCSSVFYC